MNTNSSPWLYFLPRKAEKRNHDLKPLYTTAACGELQRQTGGKKWLDNCHLRTQLIGRWYMLSATSYRFLMRSWTAEHGGLWCNDRCVFCSCCSCGGGGDGMEEGGGGAGRAERETVEGINSSMYPGSSSLRKNIDRKLKLNKIFVSSICSWTRKPIRNCSSSKIPLEAGSKSEAAFTDSNAKVFNSTLEIKRIKTCYEK